jgi:CRP/FNR family cyclic AMP-dependent transcriptional regulator
MQLTMSSSTPCAASSGHNLVAGIAANKGIDKLSCKLTQAQWDSLIQFLQPFALAQGQMLFKQASATRDLYFVESGTLLVHREDQNHDRVRIAMLGAGSVVGEGSFFSHTARNATVEASSRVALWRLTPQRFAEMSNRVPAVALQLTLGLAGVMASRLHNEPKRIAIA